MSERSGFSESELKILQEIETSITNPLDTSMQKLTDYEVCKALLRTRPIPNRAFIAHLRHQALDVQSTNTLKHPPRALAWILTTITIMVVLFFLLSTPVGRGIAQEILGFFDRESNHSLPESSIIQTPRPFVPVGLENADEHINFHLLFPQSLPDGYFLKSLEVDPDGEYAGLIFLFNGPVNTDGVLSPRLTIHQQSSPFLGLIGPDAEVLSLRVGSYSAEYVEGGWITLDSEEEKQFYWEKSLVPMQKIRWKTENLYIEMSFVGSDTQDGFLYIEDLLLIAKSLE